MPDTPLKVIIHASVGRQRSVREFPVQAVEAYTFETSMDNDADAFSVDIGDPRNKLGVLTERDTEVRATIFAPNVKSKLVPVFTGIADTVDYTSDDFVLSIAGSDLSVLAQSEAPPGRWRHVQPAQFIKARAEALGMTVNRIHKMAEIGTLYTDGSETEWAFWYRIIRQSGMFMWTEPLGGLVIDHLGYALTPTYNIGVPPRGAGASSWIRPDSVSVKSNKKRQGQVWVYAEDDKTGVAHIAKGIDTSIRSWRRKPLKIVSSSTAKSQKDAKKEADVEVYESIVGAQELECTVNDVGMLIKQNKMARLNMPDIGEVGTFFVVGVRSQAGGDGKSQVVRLREKGFALSKRVPDAPILAADKADQRTTSSLSNIISSMPGIRWGEIFVRASNEFGKPAGWDFAVFLGVLLSLCQQESGFANVRQHSHTEWTTIEDFGPGGESNAANPHAQSPAQAYSKAFANAQHNPDNPFYPSGEAGVGPMQLTTPLYKDWADQFGWNQTAKVGELDGGRWNPASNIRAAARALVQKGVAVGADPTHADQIWIAVAAYHGSTDAANNAAYVVSVKSIYKSKFSSVAVAAVAAADTKNTGTEHSWNIPGHGVVTITDTAPDLVKKALNFCMNRRGDAYKWGGFGPLYDCSGLVTAAYMAADPQLRSILTGRGETTYTLFKKGRFIAVSRDSLQPGDLVFFEPLSAGPGHVGMYIDEGLFVHDPHTGDVVKVSSLSENYYTTMYLGARRLVEWYEGLPH